MASHVALIATLYTLLTIFRAPKIWGIGKTSGGSNPFVLIEPKVSANLSNQFEWPMLFYAVSIILMVNPEFYKSAYVWLAWLFVFGRIAHSGIQIFTNNVRLRGVVFTVNFLAVLIMWAILVYDAYIAS